MDNNQILLKILSVGDTQVGKSCLIKRYCEGRFVNKYITTIGVDYGVKKMTIKGKKTAINFFDLSGDEDYKEIRNPFFEDANGILLVFDLDNKESFQNLTKWEKIMKENGVDVKNTNIFVVGNKSDLKSKECDFTDINNFCKKRGYEYYAASAAQGDNVNDIFDKLFTKCVDKIIEHYSTLI